MIHPTRLAVLQIVERGGEVETAAIAKGVRITMHRARVHIRALIAKGYLRERLEEAEGKGQKYKRFVSRTSLDLPEEIENMLDKGWWPRADVVVQQAMHCMVSLGRAT